MNSFSASALVLRRAEWRDYDRMVTLFTPEYGRMDAVARGCRRPRSPLINASEPFTCGEYQILRVGDRNTISQCRITEDFFALREDYDRLTHGAYWLRLLEEVVVEGEPYEALFHMTLRALTYLTHSNLPPALLTAMFEMQLWRMTGFSPNMEDCVVCRAPASRTALRFDARRGGCVCAVCAPGARLLFNYSCCSSDCRLRRQMRRFQMPDFYKAGRSLKYCPCWCRRGPYRRGAHDRRR